MKRDFDLIRAILLDIECNVPAVPIKYGYNFDHSDRDAVAFALHLMEQRGLIEAFHNKEMGLHDADKYLQVKLTWEGCDFLDTIRDDEIWRKTKEGVRQAGGFSFELMKALAKGMIKKKIELHTGVDLEL